MAVIQIQPVFVAIAVILGAWLARFLKTGYQWRRQFRDKALALPCPPHSWILGHIPIVVKLFEKIPRDVHPHNYGSFIGEDYKFPKFFYMDNWPLADSNLVIIDPEVAQQVTMTHAFNKHPALMFFTSHLAGYNNLVAVDGELWKKWRRIFNPGFAATHLMEMVPDIVNDTEQFVKALGRFADSGKVFRLEDIATRFTVDIIGRVTMGVSFNAQQTNHPLIQAFRSQVQWLPRAQKINPFAGLHPLRPFIMRRNTKIMHSFLEAELEKRFQSLDLTGDLNSPEWKQRRTVIDLALKEYIKEAREEGREITKLDEEFKKNAISQILIFIFAGHDTTSSTICYVYHLLSQNPDALSKLRAEHNTILGPDPSTAADTIRRDPHIINKLHYTLAVIKETLRIWPPASSVRAGSPQNFIIDPDTGKSYPTDGFLVWPVVFAIHRNPAIWPRPLEFIPERFLPEPPEELAPPPNAWRPFEKGPRNCIGQELALIESRVAIALTARTFEFQAQYDDKNWREKVVGFDGLKEEAGEWDEGVKPSQGKADSVHGEKAYQVLLGTAKPKDGMPCVVRWVE